MSHHHAYSSPTFDLNLHTNTLCQPQGPIPPLYQLLSLLLVSYISSYTANFKHHANVNCSELPATMVLPNSISIWDLKVYFMQSMVGVWEPQLKLKYASKSLDRINPLLHFQCTHMSKLPLYISLYLHCIFGAVLLDVV